MSQDMNRSFATSKLATCSQTPKGSILRLRLRKHNGLLVTIALHSRVELIVVATKKPFTLEWVFDPLRDNPTFRSKRMFGGLAAYFMDRLVMVLTESPGEKSYRGKDYSMEIWNGILFPTERGYHEELVRDFPALMPHPVLGKWLYLPFCQEDFEEMAIRLGELVLSEDPRFGVLSAKKRN